MNLSLKKLWLCIGAGLLFAVNAQAADIHLVNEQPVSITPLSSGNYLIDFGKVSFGNLRLNSSSSQNVTVHFGENLEGGRVDRDPPGTVRYNVTTVSISAGQTVTAAPPKDDRNTKSSAIKTPTHWGVVMPFRWVEVEGWSGTFDASRITRRSGFLTAWDDDAADFECSDAMLNKIWDFCKYSIKATTFAGIYVDGDRERIPYEADAYLNQLSHYYTDGDKELARDSYDHLMDHPTWPTEWAPHMVFMAYADWMHTGDTAWLSSRYSRLKGKTLMNRAESDGFVHSDSGDISRNDIVDWPKGERDGYVFKEVNTVVNAFHLRAVEMMAEMGRALGRNSDAQTYEDHLAARLPKFNTDLFKQSSGIYYDGKGTTHTALHASMFPLAFRLPAQEDREAMADWLANRGMKCSVYGAQYLMEALFENGKDVEAIELMTANGDRSWKHMVNSGSTISWEAWDMRYKSNQDWNHAWGAAPANILPRYVLGVEPLVAGWSVAKISPRIANLTSAKGKIPTRLGPALVEWTKGDKHFEYILELPAGMTAQVDLPALLGSTGVMIDGTMVNAIQENNRWVVQTPISGNKIISLAYPPPPPAYGRIAHWPLDEGEGTVAGDTAGYGFTGRLLNGATWGQDAERGTYAVFDGTDDRISTPLKNALADTNDFTWAWWAKSTLASTDSSQKGSIMVGNRYGNTGSETYEFIKFTPQGAQLADTDDSGTIERYEYADLPLNEWHHYAMVKEGASYQWYIDGQAQGVASNFNYNETSPLPFFIGGDTDNKPNEHFQGCIDDVVLYRQALTPSELTDVINGIYLPIITMVDLVDMKEWDVGTTWSDGNPAHAQADYIVPATGNLLSPSETASFPGYSLTVEPSGKFQVRSYDSDNEVITVDNLLFNGSGDHPSQLSAGAGSSVTNVLGGTISNAGMMRILSFGTPHYRSIKILSKISGSGRIQAWEGSGGQGGDNVIIDNAFNTFSGTWETGAGSTLIFASGGSVGTADIDVLDDGKLKILSDWSSEAALTVADAATTLVDLGPYTWSVDSLTIGSSNIVEGYAYDADALSAIGAAVFTGSGTIQVGEQIVLPQLMAHWGFDEGSGSIANDSSGNGYTGTIQNGANWASDGTRSSYLSFDGVDQRVLTGYMLDITEEEEDFTLAVWVNNQADPDNGVIIGNRYPTIDGNLNFFKLTSSRTEFYGGGESQSLASGSHIQNEWHHHTLVKSGSTLTYYLDGNEVVEGTISTYADGPFPFFIGGDPDGSRDSEHFKGFIDDVAVYNFALPEDRVVEVMNGRITPLPAPAAYWPLDEGDGTLAADVSGNGHDGTLENGVAWSNDITRASFASFDGVNDRIATDVQIDITAVNKDFTCVYWVNNQTLATEVVQRNSIIVGNRYPALGENLHFLKQTPTKQEVRVGGANQELNYNDLPVGEWHHCAVVKSGSSLTVYRDGIAIESRTLTTYAPAELPFFIGGDPNTSSVNEHFHGFIDDVVVYEIALPAYHIVNIMNGLNEFIPLEPPMMNMALDGGDMSFSWDGDEFKLQTRTNLTSGTWLDYPAGNTSPVTVAPTNTGAFFRLIEQ